MEVDVSDAGGDTGTVCVAVVDGGSCSVVYLIIRGCGVDLL